MHSTAQKRRDQELQLVSEDCNTRKKEIQPFHTWKKGFRLYVEEINARRRCKQAIASDLGCVGAKETWRQTLGDVGAGPSLFPPAHLATSLHSAVSYLNNRPFCHRKETC